MIVEEGIEFENKKALLLYKFLKDSNKLPSELKNVFHITEKMMDDYWKAIYNNPKMIALPVCEIEKWFDDKQK